MGRPANVNSVDTRRHLVGVAIGHFAQHGFRGASTRELAAEAGFNVATLNYHFANKQGLYDATVDEVYRRLGERAGKMLVGASLTDLDALVEKLYSAARLERDGIRLLVRQVLDHGRLTSHTESAHFLPELQYSAKLTVNLVGCTIEQARAAVVAVSYLISRYVVQDDASLVTALGVKSAKQAHARVVATLTATARALLGTHSTKEEQKE